MYTHIHTIIHTWGQFIFVNLLTAVFYREKTEEIHADMIGTCETPDRQEPWGGETASGSSVVKALGY